MDVEGGLIRLSLLSMGRQADMTCAAVGPLLLMVRGDTRKAALAQPVEHIIRNDGVACSSHASGTNKIKGLAGFPE